MRRGRMIGLSVVAALVMALWVSTAAALAGGPFAGKIIDASTGKPIQGAHACAKLMESEAGICAIANAEGNYEINPVPSSSEWEVVFTEEVNFKRQYYNGESSWEDATTIDNTSGMRITGINAELEEGPGASLSGRVTAKKTGAPVGEIRVCALASSQYEVIKCTATGADGTYLIPQLLTGSYKVAFNEPLLEFFNSTYISQFWEDKTTFATATTLALVRPESRGGIDAQLQMPGETNETPATVLPPATILLPKPVTTRPRLHCRKGFRKERVKGKLRCVRRHRHHHRKGRARHS